jgi:hypothetical protein
MADTTRILQGLRLLVALFVLTGALLSSPASAIYECTRQEQFQCMVDCVDRGGNDGTCYNGVCYCY